MHISIWNELCLEKKSNKKSELAIFHLILNNLVFFAIFDMQR